MAQALRANPSTAGIRIILLSARSGVKAQVEGLSVGADDYISKPFIAQELIGRVQSTISHSRQRAEMLDPAETAALQLRLAADALPALVSYADCEQRYQFSNRAYKDWFAHEATGRTLQAVWGDEAYAVIREHVEAALTGKRITSEADVPKLPAPSSVAPIPTLASPMTGKSNGLRSRTGVLAPSATSTTSLSGRRTRTRWK